MIGFNSWKIVTIYGWDGKEDCIILHDDYFHIALRQQVGKMTTWYFWIVEVDEQLIIPFVRAMPQYSWDLEMEGMIVVPYKGFKAGLYVKGGECVVWDLTAGINIIVGDLTVVEAIALCITEEIRSSW